MSFHAPHLLWLLVPLLLLFSWELARHTAAEAAASWPKIRRAWAGVFAVSLGSRHTTAETRPRLWLWFGLAACLLALARPQWGVIEEKVFDQSREVLLAFDLSRSMLAPDVKPSRLERGKLLVTSLLDGLKGERVGLILFSGTAFLQSPLSSDYEVLREFLPALKPDYLPEGGTNYRALLETAMQAYGTSSADRYLLVLSDGEATDDNWKPLVEQLKAKGIRVIGLGLGTAAGSFIPDGAGGFVKDDRGAVVLSRLNSSTLQELAQLTSGAYSDASSWLDLPALLKQTVEAGRKGEFTQKNTARRVERFQWFLAPGLLLLLLSFWTEFPIRPRERALPLGAARSRPAAPRPLAPVAGLAFLALALAGAPPAAHAEEGTEAFAAPLAKTVERLAAQDALSAQNCAELAQTTLTFGQRTLAAQQPPPPGVVHDGLAAVDLGEKLDAKAADWPHLRSALEELLRQQEEQKKQDQQKQQQEQQQSPQDQQSKSDQQKQQQQQQNQSQQSPPQPSDSQKPDPQEQPSPGQESSDDKPEPDKPKTEPPQPTAPPPSSGTRKVGGEKEKKAQAPLDPALAVPLQKLQQVKDLDAPAKLQQLLQGQQQRPAKPGKDW